MSAVDLEEELIKLTLSLYSNLSIPRNIVQFFIDTLSNFVIITNQTYIHQEAKSMSHQYSTEELLKTVFLKQQQIFEKFKTEHRRFNLYLEKNLLKVPIENEIGNRYVKRKVGDEIKVDKLKVNAVYNSLSWSLKVSLEIPGCFEILKNNMETLYSETQVTSNFIQCELWKKKCKDFGNRFVIPLFIFQDDCETGNSMGSHAGKNNLGVLSASIPCFPSHLLSRLDNILMTNLTYASDRKSSEKNLFYKKLFTELNSLSQNGLCIDVNGKILTVYFQLVLVLGDNLGVNEMLGFVDSFNSGHPCRICKASIEQIKSMVRENGSIIRTKEMYDDDCNLQEPKRTGIKSPCVFHQVGGFHICDNFCLDMMHDIFEGVANYLMINVTDNLIFKRKLFSLEYLNEKLSTFPYGYVENSNRIPLIKKDHIVTKKKLRMSAAEMICFCRYFCVLVGEKIRPDDEVWKLYLLLRKIIAILLSPRIIQGHIFTLEILIPEFLSLYKDLFGELKFKFHNMIHIVRSLLNNGPLIHYWSMRYESKHQEVTKASSSTSNKRNLLKTICLRNQLRLAYFRVSKRIDNNQIIATKMEEISPQERKSFWPESNEFENIFSSDHVIFNEKEYRCGGIHVSEIGEEDLLIFGKIMNIFIKGDEIFLLLQPYHTIFFDDHYFSYIVQPKRVNFLKNIKDIPNLHPCIMIENNDCTMVVTRHIL